jgi:hypothetical protein
MSFSHRTPFVFMNKKFNFSDVEHKLFQIHLNIMPDRFLGYYDLYEATEECIVRAVDVINESWYREAADQAVILDV